MTGAFADLGLAPETEATPRARCGAGLEPASASGAKAATADARLGACPAGLLDDVAGAVIVDYHGAVVVLRATARSDDHAAYAGHRLRQRLTTANVCDESRHVWRKDLATLGGVSD